MGGHLMAVLEAAYPDAELVSIGRDPYRIDLCDHAAIDLLVKRLRPDGCIHLAAVSAIGEARKEPHRAWAVNLHATLALAASLLHHAPMCRLVFASTSDLYGASFRSGLPLDEDALPAPLNTYSATKAAADIALGAMAAEGLLVTRVRPFNHTGPGQQPEFAVPSFARQVMRIATGRQAPTLEVGDLTPLRDFLDVRDVCAAYAACLRPDVELAGGTILNVASGQPRRIGDVLRDLLAEAGVAAEIAPKTALMRSTDIPFAVGNADRARQLLGWRPRVEWQVTIRDVIADWRERVAAEPA